MKKVPTVYDATNEELFIAGFRRGDNEVFKDLHAHLSPLLTYYVENIVHSPVDAEDIVANAFYKLLLSREKMKSYNHVKRWLYVVVYNQAIDHIRSHQRQREASEELSYLAGDSEGSINSENLKTSQMQSIANAIYKLPRQRKKIVRLYFFEKKTTRQIAAILCLSPQTVLNHKTKALESLRKNPAFVGE